MSGSNCPKCGKFREYDRDCEVCAWIANAERRGEARADAEWREKLRELARWAQKPGCWDAFTGYRSAMDDVLRKLREMGVEP
jgi:hypothetical protein